tara:strand:- start:341 stop:745 length:405 start_codon:yes stop_codon:yes gene_type:complete
MIKQDITWEFESWAEKATYEAFIIGTDSDGIEYEAIGIMGVGDIQEVKEIMKKDSFPTTIKSELVRFHAWCDRGRFTEDLSNYKEDVEHYLEESNIEKNNIKYDCLHNQFCDKQSKDCKMFCTYKKGCSFKVES